MTSRTASTAGSLAHFVAAPGVTIALIPWLLTGWEAADDPWSPALRLPGLLLAALGVIVVGVEFVRFVREGRGTPMPLMPTEVLVVGGLYAHVRNPMYVAVTAAIAGQGLALSRPVLLGYAVVFAAVVWAFARWYEEPALAAAFGSEYDAYRRAVPGWWPRLRAWRP